MNGEQSKKSLHQQAEEVRAHIADGDYCLAEEKVGIICESLRKGDWTLGDLE